MPPALDLVIRIAAWLFLAGILMVLGSAVPALARRFPRMFLSGFLLSAGSLVLVLLGAITLR